jgi:glycosyltransferase involved in cell wall biosynthesis
MRSLYFLVPGTRQQFFCGGLFAELKTLAIAQQICSAAVVTYRQREPETLFLDDVLAQGKLTDVIFVISWGFDVPKLARRLQGQQVVYHAHSSGYGFSLPASIPIITVSRNSMAYWGQRSPNALIYYLPNQIDDAFTDHHQPRDIDVLVQARKSSEYLLHQLVPALQARCNVVVLDSFVEDLVGLFNRTKIYLYDSAEYWALSRVSEGFGLPPMEAMACGCQVFSSVNGALADYLDPGFNCYKIGCYSLAYDTERILQALQSPTCRGLSATALDGYRAETIQKRLSVILTELNAYFDHMEKHPSDVPGLSRGRMLRLWLQNTTRKVKKKLVG